MPRPAKPHRVFNVSVRVTTASRLSLVEQPPSPGNFVDDLNEIRWFDDLGGTIFTDDLGH